MKIPSAHYILLLLLIPCQTQGIKLNKPESTPKNNRIGARKKHKISSVAVRFFLVIIFLKVLFSIKKNYYRQKQEKAAEEINDRIYRHYNYLGQLLAQHIEICLKDTQSSYEETEKELTPSEMKALLEKITEIKFTIPINSGGKALDKTHETKIFWSKYKTKGEEYPFMAYLDLLSCLTFVEIIEPISRIYSVQEAEWVYRIKQITHIKIENRTEWIKIDWKLFERIILKATN